MSGHYCSSGHNCNCSPREAFPDYEMSADHVHRASMTPSFPSAPQSFGGAFEGPSTDMQSSFLTTVGDLNDPRVEPIFEGVSPNMGTSAPSATRMSNNFFRDPNPTIIGMSRARSDNKAMSSSGFSTADRAPTRDFFASQGGALGMEGSGSNHLTVSIPANIYRENPPTPASYTGSSVSRGGISHRSSNASNYPPHTPISEFDMPFGELSVGSSPQYPPYMSHVPSYSQMSGGFATPDGGYLLSPHESMAPPQSSQMARNPSSQRSQKEKKFWCDVENCAHGRAFGTRNDLDRHKLAVHRQVSPNSNSKVYICQGASCLQQSRGKIWPRKDNFKNHCKVAHGEVNVDDLISRSEREVKKLEPQEIEGLQVEDESSQSTTPDPAKHTGTSQATPRLRVSLSPVTRVPRDSDPVTPISPGHLSPSDGRRHSFSRNINTTNLKRSPSASSVHTIATVRQQSHRQSLSTSDAPKMAKSSSYPPAKPRHASQSADLPFANVEELRAFLLQKNAPSHLIESLTAENVGGVKRERDDEQPHDSRPFKCDNAKCSKAFRRACDLKKHRTRHTKPWGCTDSACKRTFGSKNDWKRHELSRHYQQPTWICGEAPLVPNAVGRCTANFESDEQFKEHLRTKHGLPDDEALAKKLQQRQIGRNWAGAVWCGFCKLIIPLTRENQDAWNERFDHIDSHLNGTFVPTAEQVRQSPQVEKLEGKELKIEQWYPPNMDLCKGQFSVSDSEQLGSGWRDGQTVEEGYDTEPDEDGEGEEDETSPVVALSDGLGIGCCDPRLMQSPSKRRRVSFQYIWHCPNCSNGPMLWEVHDSCAACGLQKNDMVQKEVYYEESDDFE